MDWFQVCAVCACLCARGLATPPPGYVKLPDKDQHPPKYEFGYDVKDGYGGSQGHLETRDGEYALGKYYVNLPSNEQKVDYFADDWGFHPLVEYRTSSGSSSMSTQFALGEKAVAALSRQYGVAPPLEILKTKVAQSLVAGAGPQVSIQASSGIIPGPSDEPVHNSLEGETYSSTTTTSSPPIVQVSVTPSSFRYKSTPSFNLQQISGGVEVSTESPSTIIVPGRVHSTTESYPTSGTGNEGSYQGSFESQKKSSFYQSSSGSTGYSTTENYPTPKVRNEGILQGEVESQNQNSYYQSASSGATGYTSTGPSVLREYTPPAGGVYQTVSGPAVSSAQLYYGQGGQSSSLAGTQNGHQVTSYLADSNAAVDVTSNVLSQRLPGVPEYNQNTRISAVLVAEGENRYEENEIRNDYNNRYVSSTTPSPPKTNFKPIVVSESGHKDATLALFSAQGLPSTERTHSTNVLGKLYHKEGRLKSNEGYSTASLSDVRTDSALSKGQQYYSTPAPTAEPVLITPRVEASLLTSSGNILAPIQAGVSISNHQHQEEECDEQTVVGEDGSTPSSGPDIEKQVLREEAVYKTTVDIQKSIPFEIHPEENDQHSSVEQGSQEQHNQHSQVNYNQGTQGEYEETEREEYKQNTQVEYNQIPSVVYSQNSQEEHESTSEEEYQQSSQADYQTPSQYQTQIPVTGPTQVEYSGGVNTNQLNQNDFLQQVVYAYHKMANNENKQQITNNGGYSVNYPAPTQPLFVPNRMYYVYLQRFNPYVNRYGSQSQLYTNYRAPVTSTPMVQVPTGSYNYHEGQVQENNVHALAQSEQDYQGGSNYNVNGNAGYTAFVNHEGARENGLYEQQSVSNINANNVYEQGGESRLPSQAISTEESQRGTENIKENIGQVDNGGNGNINSASSSQYESSQQAAKEYASQVNNVLRGDVSAVPHESQQVQYSTAHGEESGALAQGNYQEENTDQRQLESVGGQVSQEKFIEETVNDVLQNTNIFHKGVPQYIERTKLVEVEKPVHIHHPVPVEYTKIVEKHVPVAHPVPVHHTQFVEKHVPVPQPVPVEVTRYVEKPVPVPHPVAVEYTKVVAVEKPVAVPHPVPYAVTKLVAVDRPVAYPHPVPFPYAVPHPVGVPVPQLIPYPHVVTVPVKDYRPVYVYRKPTGGRLLHRDAHQSKHLAFRPSQPVFTSQYPPQTYHVTGYLTGPQAKSRLHHGRKLCIEYGGFKPPLVPSVQVPEDHKPSYGPPAEDKH